VNSGLGELRTVRKSVLATVTEFFMQRNCGLLGTKPGWADLAYGKT